jgi:hypothetical protein
MENVAKLSPSFKMTLFICQTSLSLLMDNKNVDNFNKKEDDKKKMKTTSNKLFKK